MNIWLEKKVGEPGCCTSRSAADSKAAQASHWNKVVGIPMFFRLDRAETGDANH